MASRSVGQKNKVVKPNPNRLIILEGNGEMIVFRLADEKKMMISYFNDPKDRDIEDYDRHEIHGDVAAVINATLKVQ